MSGRLGRGAVNRGSAFKSDGSETQLRVRYEPATVGFHFGCCYHERISLAQAFMQKLLRLSRSSQPTGRYDGKRFAPIPWTRIIADGHGVFIWHDSVLSKPAPYVLRGDRINRCSDRNPLSELDTTNPKDNRCQ